MDDVANIDSQTVRAGSTTYFIDVKQTKSGKLYLTITESRFQGEGKKHRRSSISIFPEHILDFLQALNSIAGTIEQPK